MWVFYLISLPLTLGMVLFTLRYFAGPDVPHYVLFTVGYTWFCSISIIILVPADIWTTTIGQENRGIAFFWSWSYWSTFLLTWAVVPIIQGYEDAGDFTVKERLKTSAHANLVFYLILGFVGLFGLILLIIMRRDWSNVIGLAMACSNTFGLVTGAFLLGFGLSEIPKSYWRNADWITRQKVLSHKVAKMAVKLDNAHQQFSNAIVVSQATSNQMSKRDPLRPYMNIVDKMLNEMLREDPSFKPQGGQLGENDMDYDTDEKSMATLRRQLRIAREEYYRYKSEYMTYVMEALELEDTIKNHEHRISTGWKYISSFRPARNGTLGSILDRLELVWRCVIRKQLEKFLAILFGCMSVAILLAEATLLPSGLHLSLFSLLINAMGKEEMLVQVAAFIPLMYMCMCTYYSLFKIGMLMFYSFTPRQTSSVSLLMICSMVARYAPPISYNFLNLIRLDGNAKTVFEKRMGNIDDAVPFFGLGFNKIYPLIMVVYTILVASNFFDRVVDFLGSWIRFRFQSQADDTDGFDPSGLIILQKERSWLEQRHKIGEHVFSLARNFNNTSMDVETGNAMDKVAIELKASRQSNSSTEASRKYASSREAMENKYAAIRQQQIKQAASNTQAEKNITSAKVSLLGTGNSQSQNSTDNTAPSGLASKWVSMKNGFQTFKENMEAKNFLPLRQGQDTKLISCVSSSESLDQIFHRLKKPSGGHDSYGDEDDDDDTETRDVGSSR
ncbi:hypothetical protein MKX01_009675 [Papaver californicum]|nr:hypothetical protein MKX01_009675 [Papaver californicum]